MTSRGRFVDLCSRGSGQGCKGPGFDRRRMEIDQPVWPTIAAATVFASWVLWVASRGGRQAWRDNHSLSGSQPAQ